MEWFVFVLISVALIVVPGPNILVIVSTSIRYGAKSGLCTVAGTSTAMILQLCVAALGTSWLVTQLSQGFIWLKWAGVVYLAYLALSHLLSNNNARHKEVSSIGSFQWGFWVSLTNPKTILFFSAFLPQFVTTDGAYHQQIALLSCCFWLLALIIDSGYALLANAVRHQLQRNGLLLRHQNRISGALYAGASAVLALSSDQQS